MSLFARVELDFFINLLFSSLNCDVQELLRNPDDTSYLFFPVVSRYHYNHSDAGSYEKLSAKVNQIVMDDMRINEIMWPGFGTHIHKNFFGSQFVIGNGQRNVEESTGTDWHCAPGSNYFVQV